MDFSGVYPINLKYILSVNGLLKSTQNTFVKKIVRNEILKKLKEFEEG